MQSVIWRGLVHSRKVSVCAHQNSITELDAIPQFAALESEEVLFGRLLS